MWVASDARRRLRSLLGIAAIVAISVAVVLATAAGARRDGSAMVRLQNESMAATVMVLPNTPGFDWSQIRKLPYVETVGEFDLSGYGTQGGKLPNDGSGGGFAPASPELYTAVERGVLIQGRFADPARPDELMMTPGSKKLGLHVGSHVQLQTWRADKVKDYAQLPQPPAPDGPVVNATIVGVEKTPFYVAFGGTDTGGVIPTYAFYQQYHANFMPFIGVPVENALLRFRDGYKYLPELSAAVNKIAGHPVEITREDEATKSARQATSLERGALLGFALAAALAALVLIGQAIVRMIAAGAGDMPTLEGLGFTRVQMTIALAFATTLAALGGVVVALVLAYALSGRFPIGVGRTLEPAPGLHADWFVFGVGVLVVLALIAVGIGGVSAWYVWRGEIARRRHASRLAAAVRDAGAPLPLALGTQLALERTPGRASVPVRPAIVGAIVGVIGITGALTFRTGLTRAATDRALYGAQFDAGIESDAPEHVPPELKSRLLSDPDIQTLNATTISVVLVNGRSITVFTDDAIRGATKIVTTSGHPMANDHEIVLAPTEADALHVHAGDSVTVGSGPTAQRMTVAGIGFTPVSSHTTYDQGGWMTPGGLHAVDPKNDDRKYFVYAIAFRPGVNAAHAIDALNHPTNVGAAAIDLPSPLGYLHNVRTIPLALGTFLVLLAIAAVGHTLASMVGRRRREIAILRSLGFTRRQVRASVAWQATTLAVVGVVVGIPLGVLIGRLIWRLVADATPVKYVPPFAALVVLIVVPAALLIANALAAWPARRAARLQAAEILRTE